MQDEQKKNQSDKCLQDRTGQKLTPREHQDVLGEEHNVL